MIAGLEGLKDLKVAMEFHDIMNAKAIRLAEANRSDLTLRDIERNLGRNQTGVELFSSDCGACSKGPAGCGFR
ncbi:MAG: hypothetical protein WDM89_21325 [Rhizomicrobium sp.]